jgi:hypothetical protein
MQHDIEQTTLPGEIDSGHILDRLTRAARSINAPQLSAKLGYQGRAIGQESDTPR